MHKSSAEMHVIDHTEVDPMTELRYRLPKMSPVQKLAFAIIDDAVMALRVEGQAFDEAFLWLTEPSEGINHWLDVLGVQDHARLQRKMRQHFSTPQTSQRLRSHVIPGRVGKISLFEAERADRMRKAEILRAKGMIA